ncbi:hypothetical protein [Grimontia celer]|uniref:hypothetical protein n=1 Tax=Grimontia celer TaxID=1796497 RepID=UPI001E5E7D2B|nr:hypothetical protein [Grimontia celer]
MLCIQHRQGNARPQVAHHRGGAHAHAAATGLCRTGDRDVGHHDTLTFTVQLGVGGLGRHFPAGIGVVRQDTLLFVLCACPALESGQVNHRPGVERRPGVHPG